MSKTSETSVTEDPHNDWWYHALNRIEEIHTENNDKIGKVSKKTTENKSVNLIKTDK
ncbi:hypothetical protein LOAG_09864, partial [Loa loa]